MPPASWTQARRLLRFAAALPSFLRATITVEQARDEIRRALEAREASFLELARRAIYGRPRGPYRRLLARAGCTFGDLEAMVRSEGLEPTLGRLRDAGVYLTFEELKGTVPLVRGGETIPLRQEDLDNPLLRRAYRARTSGSSGHPTPAWMDLDHLAAQACRHLVAREAHGVRGVPSAVWQPLLPSASGLNAVLRGARAGETPQRWFTPLGPSASRHRLAGWSTYGLVALGRLAGSGLPWPRVVELEEAAAVGRWAVETLAHRGAGLVVCTVSQAVRVARAAMEAGWDLRGATFFVVGEPATEAKVAIVRASGARCIPFYNFVEIGLVGIGCAASSRSGDLHLTADLAATITVERRIEGWGRSMDALCFTSLRPGAPKILLNVESDDHGLVERATCGCPFAAIGYTRIVRDVQSERKLTGEGVTLAGSEMLRVLEESLPRRYGGTPLDYQLLEEEGEQGLTRLVLLVDPALGPIAPEELIAVVFDHLRQRGGGAELAAAVWNQAGSLHVRRTRPIWSSGGKLSPLRSARREIGESDRGGR
jgi:hypothetical protein